MTALFLATPRPQIHRWAADCVVLTLWGLVAPMALVAPKALQILVWLLPLASLAAVARAGTGVRLTWLRPLHAVAAIPLLALICAPLSVDPMESAGRALRMVVEFTALCLLITSTAALGDALRRRAVQACGVGVAIAATIILLDLATHGALLTPFWGAAPSWEWRKISYNRGETSLAILLPITALGFAAGGRRALLAAATLILCLAAIFAGASNSARIAVLMAGGAFLAVLALPGLLRIGLWAVALLVLAAPWALDAVPPRPLIERSGATLQSIVHRTYIWDFAIARIKERPLLGWGLDASRRMPGGDEEITVSGLNKAGAPGAGEATMTGQVMPLHPHNGALQIWLELGGAGALLAAALIALAAESLAKLRLSRAVAAMTAGIFAAGTAVALVSYGLWQGWWLSVLFLMAALPFLARKQT